MTVIHVPRPPQSAMNPDRPANALLLSQVSHLQHAERRLPLRYRTKIYTHAIETESEAAEYIREVTEAIHQAHADAAKRRARHARRPVIEIAAAADEGTKRKSRSKAKAKSGAKRGRKKRGDPPGGGMRWSGMLVLLGASTLALAQESPLRGELRREGERFSDACAAFNFKSVPGCAYTLFTDHPLHIAAGSMPPQNGFGLGGAFVLSKNTRNWRVSWDFDAVGAFSGSWRAGGYMKMVHTPHPAKPQIRATHPYTVFNLYAQTISLNKLNFFGLGNDSPLAGKSLFGMSERIVGASAIKPVFEWAAIRWLNLALLGEINGRFIDIRGKHGQSVPSIEALYTDATAPGLSSQPGFAQLGEGLRIKPAIGNLQLNYVGKFQQFFAPSSSHNSFLRWTVDLDHTYSLYGSSQSGAASLISGLTPSGLPPGLTVGPPTGPQ